MIEISNDHEVKFLMRGNQLNHNLLTLSQAADTLSVKVSTLRKWVLLRKITYCKPGGRVVRIPASEITRLQETTMVPRLEA